MCDKLEEIKFMVKYMLIGILIGLVIVTILNVIQLYNNSGYFVVHVAQHQYESLRCDISILKDMT